MIRIENPKVVKFVAERIMKIAQQRGKPIDDDIEGNHVFVGWRLGKIFICWTSDFGRKSISAYVDDGPDSKWDDLFFISYHYPKFDDELGGGLLTFGKSQTNHKE